MNKLSHYDLWPKITLIITAVFLTAALNVPFVLKEIVRGAPIHGANGLMFDAQDNLYIASVWGREIVVMNPLNGEIIDRLGTEVGVESPDDLTSVRMARSTGHPSSRVRSAGCPQEG